MKTMKHCLRCGYKWESDIDPKCCPRCKTYDHQKPRKRAGKELRRITGE